MDGIGAPVKMKISIKYEKKGKDMFSDFWLSAVQTKKPAAVGFLKLQAGGSVFSSFFCAFIRQPGRLVLRLPGNFHGLDDNKETLKLFFI